jgi:hypothetical protein
VTQLVINHLRLVFVVGGGIVGVGVGIGSVDIGICGGGDRFDAVVVVQWLWSSGYGC